MIKKTLKKILSSCSRSFYHSSFLEKQGKPLKKLTLQGYLLLKEYFALNETYSTYNEVFNNKEKFKEEALFLQKHFSIDPFFSVSILIPVYHPNKEFFKKALLSALEQVCPQKEVLVGLDGKQPSHVYEVLEELKILYPNVLKVHEIERSGGGGISRTTNYLAEKATHKFLLLMDHDDWIRIDLLSQYELALKSHEKKENVVLYCDEFKINEYDNVLEKSFKRKTASPHFPYLVCNFICHCLLVSKDLWQKVGGLRPLTDGAQDFDLTLRLKVEGACFVKVPYFLYAWRCHAASTAKKGDAKPYALQAGIDALTHFYKELDLPVAVSAGKLAYSHRIKAIFDTTPSLLTCVYQKKENPSFSLENQSLSATKTAFLSFETIQEGFLEALKIAKTENFEFLFFIENTLDIDKEAIQSLLEIALLKNVAIATGQVLNKNGSFIHTGIYFKEGESSFPRIIDSVTASNTLERAPQIISKTEAPFPSFFLLKVAAIEDFRITSSSFLCNLKNLSDDLLQKGELTLYTPYAQAVLKEKSLSANVSYANV